MELAPGTEVDRYVVESLLGEGGMAMVYRVRHTELNTVHALKVLSISSPSVRTRLLREGRVQAQLRHPNIVNVTDVVDVQGAHGLVMDLVRGPNLFQLLSHNRLPIEQADAVALGILSGMRAAHEAGLIHRDLKPANVLLDVQAGALVPKVSDFGLAKIASGGIRSTGSGVALGTPSYMAPEQIRSAKDVDHRADVFALGAILYDLYCGAQAFEGSDVLEIFKNVTAGRFVAPLEHVPALPDRVVRAILGAMAVPVEERLGSVQELIDVLFTGVPSAPLAPSPWSDELLNSVRDITEEAPGIRPDKTPGPDANTSSPSPSRSVLLGAALSVALLALLALRPSSRPMPVLDETPSGAATVEQHEPVVEVEPLTPVPVALPSPTRVLVQGDVTVDLVGGGDAHRPGEVPPGAYEVRGILDGRPMVLGQVVAVRGKTVEIVCSAAMMVCRTASSVDDSVNRDVWEDPPVEAEQPKSAIGGGSPWEDPG